MSDDTATSEATIEPRSGPFVVSVHFVIDASTKSALPKNGMVVCSWATYTSMVFLSGPGRMPTPSGMPSNIVPSTTSPLEMIART